MAALSLCLLGQFQVTLNGQPLPSFRTKKAQALLIFLAAEQNTAHRRDALMNLFWPGMPERSARHNLRQALYHLRLVVPELDRKERYDQSSVELLLTNRQTIRLNPAADVSLDTRCFEALIDQTQTHDHLDLITCPGCREDLAQAVSFYQGDFLTDFYLDDSNAFEEWAEINREGYRRKMLDALETLTAIYLRQKAYGEARAYAERQLDIDNLRESAYRQLMEVLALSGQRAEAAAVYESCRRLLLEELGMEPMIRTTEVHEKVLAGELSFDTSPVRGARGYELKEEIGEGAFGSIYRAVQPGVDREVAVKIIRRKYANDGEFIRRFEAEAQTVARLEHPYIVPLYDYWREPDGAYLVMRLLRGGSLLSSLECGPWDIESTLRMVDQIASALSAAHQREVIHRDIKPANILFDEANNAYLTDFGIAKNLTADMRMTATGAVVGTPDYISPEQILSEPVGPASDIYSFGAVLYETLTGEKPYPDTSLAALLHKQLNEPLPLVSTSLPGIPAAIDSVIQRATAKRPADRYASALELAEAFRRAIRGGKTEKRVTIATAIPAGVEVANPYKGLRAFQEADAADFFGREALIERLVARLAIPTPEEENPSGNRFLAVVGPSGSGKSSVVKAGLIPALREGAIPGSEKWFVAEMVPGSHPLEELELALLPIAVDPPPSLVEPMRKDARGLLRTIRRVLPDEEGAQLLLVIDQFEELFTLVEDEGRQIHFIDSLLAALASPRTPLRVVITLRADFYDRPLQYQPLGELLKRATELVLPMTAEELTWAVQEPARRVGVGMEEGLLAAIAAGVGDQPGALPLVQYAMTELFDERQDGLMTRAAYEKIGGVLGALGSRAEELYLGQDEVGQESVRQLFMRLVTLGEGTMAGEATPDTRRPVLRAELEALDTIPQSPIPALIEACGQARLLTFDRDPATRGPTVEVAHEALLREWPRLSRWLSESRADIRLQRMLARAAAEWQEADRNADFLLRGARLDQFSGWAETSTVVLTSDELAFLKASSTARESRQAEEEARRQRELETAQRLAETERARAEEQAQAAGRLRRLAVVLAGALLIAAALAVAAVSFARLASTREAEALAEADQRATAVAVANVERQTAEEQTRLAFSRELAAAALNNLAEDQERAVLLALQALAQAQTQEAEDALHRTAQELRLVHTLDAPGRSPFVALSPDGHLLVTSGPGGATVWDAITGEIIYELDVGYINRASFSPDGTLLVLPHENTSEESPEGYLEPSAVSIMDAETGEEHLTFLAHDAWVQDVSFSSDGALFVTASGDGTAKVWDLADTLAAGEGRERLTLSFDETFPWVAYFSPDGTRIATANDDGIVQIWDASTGQELLHLNCESYDLALSPDGSRLVTGNRTGMLEVYDTHSGQKLSRILAHDLFVHTVAFSSDGDKIASTSDDSTVKVWAFSEDSLSPLLTLAGHEVRANMVVFSPDGERLLSGGANFAGEDLVVRIWDISPDGNVEPIVYPHEEIVNGLAFNPEGTRLATAGADGRAIIWDVVSGRSLQILSGHDWIWRLVYSPDGSLLATAGRDGTVKLWDAASGRELSALSGHAIPKESEFFRGVLGVAFSPDGKRLATAGGDGRVGLWDVAALRSGDLEIGDEMFFLGDDPEAPYGQFSMDVSFSPDGRYIAASINNWLDAVSSYGNGTVQVWDAATGGRMWTVRREDGQPYTYTYIAFSPDGKRLAAGVFDGQVTVWRLPDDPAGTLVESFTIQAGKGFVTKMHFSRDGRQLAVAHMDGMGIWDASTGEFQRTFPHPGSVMEAVYSPDGKRLATAGFDGAGRLFILSVDELTDLAKSRLTRSLTDEECQQYLHVDECPDS